MIKVIFAFLILTGAFYFFLSYKRKLNPKDKKALTKTVVDAILCATLALFTFIGFVAIF
jgi:hypothetical protein